MRVSKFSRLLVPVVALLLVAALGGCSFFTKKKVNVLDTLTVEQLYDRGMAALDANGWDRAQATFSRLIARYPFGPYTEQAQLDLAYAQYKGGKPEDAYSTANRFIKTYPTHKHVDYAYYLRGLVNFNRSAGMLEAYIGKDMTKRDQAYLRQSFDDFGELVKRYPQSRYAADAAQRMVYLRSVMAQSDVNVALYYLRTGAYVGAANRAKAILETYPQSTQAGDALAIMMFSYRKLGQDKLADDAERVLKLNYPNHPALADKWPTRRSNAWKLIPFTNR